MKKIEIPLKLTFTEDQLLSYLSNDKINDLVDQKVNALTFEKDSLVGKPLSEIIDFYIKQTLILKDNIEETAKTLQIGERTLYRWLKQNKKPHLKRREVV